MIMKVAGSSLKNNIIGSIDLSIELATDGPTPFSHKMSFLIAHHINGYDMILGADFLLKPFTCDGYNALYYYAIRKGPHSMRALCIEKHGK